MKRSQIIFFILCIMQVFLNSLCHTLCVHTLEIYKYPEYFPLARVLWSIGLIISILILFFSVKLKNSSIVFVFLYWLIGIAILQYRMYLLYYISPVSKAINLLLYESWSLLWFRNIPEYLKPLFTNFNYMLLIFIIFAIISLVFLIRYYIIKHKESVNV